MGSRVWLDAELGWVGLVALLGVVVDSSPSGWDVIATRGCGTQNVGGFSSLCSVWFRVSFRFDKTCKFRVQWESLGSCYLPLWDQVPPPWLCTCAGDVPQSSNYCWSVHVCCFF